MKIYEGKIGLIGSGTYVGQSRGTRRSVVEIGDKALRNVFMPDYIANYVEPDKEVRLMLYRGFNQKIIVAAEAGQKKYKIERSWMLTLAFIPAVLITLTFGSFIGIYTANTEDNFIKGFIGVFILASLWSIKKMYDFLSF